LVFLLSITLDTAHYYIHNILEAH